MADKSYFCQQHHIKPSNLEDDYGLRFKITLKLMYGIHPYNLSAQQFKCAVLSLEVKKKQIENIILFNKFSISC